MKANKLKLLALIISIIMVLSSLSILVSAAPSTYSKTSNSGTRNEICTTLDGTSASSYYTGSYTYDNLITLSSSALKSSLHDLMTNTHTKITSYNDCRDMVFSVDCERNDTTHATTLYTSYSMTSSDWSPAWNCNREHVWPQSLGGGNTSGGGSDLHHIRPAEKGVNSSRGNKAYGVGGSYYTPKDNVKGDVARIILYVYVRWDAAWGATNITSVFQSVDVLLEWCELDPVDTWEMGRNEVVQNIQGNRNVFIDYPELAWQLFGREVPEDMATPSNAAASGNVPTPPVGGDDGNDTPDTPTTPGEIPEYLVIKNDTKYVTNQSYVYTSSSGKSKNQMVLTDNKSDAATFQLVNNSDGTVSFKNDGKFLYADGTDVKLVDTNGDNTKFVFEENGSGYFVKCAYATYSGKPQYLEIYSGYLTCYGMGTNTSIYTFTFEQSDDAPVDPNPGDNEKPSTPDGLVATFEFGENGGAAHSDGIDATGSKTYTDGNYSLTITNLTKIYVDARDAQGNSCIKVGASSSVGTLSFSVADDIEKVVIYIAQYKVKNTTVEINGKQYAINTSSNDGAYTPIEIDTSTVKNIDLSTISGESRCMINTIEFFAAVSEPDVDDPTGSEDTTQTPDEITTEESTSEVITDEITTDEATTEAATNEATTEETDSTEIDSAEISTEVATTENAADDTTTEATDTPENKGCGSSVAGGAIIVSILCLGAYTVSGKKKED